MGPPRFELGSPAPKERLESLFFPQTAIQYSKLRNDFINWFKEKGVKESTYSNYVSILDRTIKFVIIQSPEQLKEIYNSLDKNKSNFAKGFRNLLNFMVEKKLISKAVAEEFKAAIPIPKSGTDKKIPEDEAILKANEHFRKNLNEIYYLVFQLLVFSGLRLEHLCDMLNNFDPANLEIFEDRGFARYNMSGIGSRNKEAFECYMPSWLGKKLLHLYKKNNGFRVDYQYAKKVINYKYVKRVEVGGDVVETTVTVSSKYIRKWTNRFLKKMKVPAAERNFILGRVSEIGKSVEFHNYLDLREDADEEYARIVDKFPIKEVNHED